MKNNLTLPTCLKTLIAVLLILCMMCAAVSCARPTAPTKDTLSTDAATTVNDDTAKNNDTDTTTSVSGNDTTVTPIQSDDTTAATEDTAKATDDITKKAEDTTKAVESTETQTATPITDGRTEPVEPATKALSASGTLTAETGTSLVFYADWAAEQAAGSADCKITFTFRLQHYDLYKSATIGKLKINGTELQFKTDAIDTLDKPGKTVSTLGTAQVTVKRGAGETLNLPVEVQWMYGGVYHEVDLEWITVTGNILLAD